MSSLLSNIECARLEDYGQMKFEINSILKKKEIFTDPTMRLSKFAERIHVSPKNFSRIMKKEFDIGFNELLNKYRIQFSIERIEDGYLDKYTIEALGGASGFSSRTTFFNSFKKEKGIGPSEYWKKFQELPI